MRPSVSERFRMHPAASERVRMHPSRSERVPKHRKTCETEEKLQKICEKLRKKLKKFAHGWLLMDASKLRLMGIVRAVSDGRRTAGGRSLDGRRTDVGRSSDDRRTVVGRPSDGRRTAFRLVSRHMCLLAGTHVPSSQGTTEYHSFVIS